MITILSPAKSLDFESKPATNQFTQAEFLSESTVISNKLRTLRTNDLIKLMGISAKLAALNVERNQRWELPFTPENAKQAVLAFNGDVYEGLRAPTFSDADFAFAQQHFRILSGLYGVLRPLDLIQPYRLEMGTKLRIGQTTDLYQFWDDKITRYLNKEVEANGGVLVNLASAEYFKAIDQKKFKGEIITPEFKEGKNGEYKIVSFFAKKARGMMSRFIIENRLDKAEDLKAFDNDGYNFNPRLSTNNHLLFTRDK
ncbi:MAG: peroxide stress protein YaaA [Mangrovibacterium sp.]